MQESEEIADYEGLVEFEYILCRSIDAQKGNDHWYERIGFVYDPAKPISTDIIDVESINYHPVVNFYSMYREGNSFTLDWKCPLDTDYGVEIRSHYYKPNEELRRRYR